MICQLGSSQHCATKVQKSLDAKASRGCNCPPYLQILLLRSSKSLTSVTDRHNNHNQELRERTLTVSFHTEAEKHAETKLPETRTVTCEAMWEAAIL